MPGRPTECCINRLLSRSGWNQSPEDRYSEMIEREEFAGQGAGEKIPCAPFFRASVYGVDLRNNPLDFSAVLRIIGCKARFWEEAFSGQQGAPLLPGSNKCFP